VRRVGIARSHGRLEEFDHYVEMLTQDEMPAEALLKTNTTKSEDSVQNNLSGTHDLCK
jgi:hypothetical protein